MTSRQLLLLGLAGTLFSSEASAENKLLAVLPLDVRMAQGAVSASARASLEEAIRDAAIEHVAPAGWTVLTGETTLQVLRDNGIDPARCGDESCHLTIAREIKAGKFISGSVQLDGNELTASIRLVDTQSGRVLSAAPLNGSSTKALRESFADKSVSFFVQGGLLALEAPAIGASDGGASRDAVSRRMGAAQAELDSPESVLVIEPTEQHRVMVTDDAPSLPARAPMRTDDEVWVLGRHQQDRQVLATVDVGPFRIDRGEVTVAAFAECVRAGTCSEPSHGGDCRWDSGADMQSVNCVDWYQARQFCAWIGQHLPTADEWELAVNGEVRMPTDDEVVTASAGRVSINNGVWEWTDTTVGSRMMLARLSSGASVDNRIVSRRLGAPDTRDEMIGFRCRK